MQTVEAKVKTINNHKAKAKKDGRSGRPPPVDNSDAAMVTATRQK
jgi:hypothetical protein